MVKIGINVKIYKEKPFCAFAWQERGNVRKYISRKSFLYIEDFGIISERFLVANSGFAHCLSLTRPSIRIAPNCIQLYNTFFNGKRNVKDSYKEYFKLKFNWVDYEDS